MSFDYTKNPTEWWEILAWNLIEAAWGEIFARAVGSKDKGN